MNRRLNWANGATALNMRSLQHSVANWHPAFSPLCFGRFVQSPFIKPAQGRGEFSGLATSSPVQAVAARIGAAFAQCFVPGIPRRARERRQASWSSEKEQEP